MEKISYILILLTSYLGILAGNIISGMAKEELLPGRKYFLKLKTILASAIIYIFIYSITKSYIFSIIVPMITILIIHHWKSDFYAVIAYYCIFGAALHEIISPIAGSLIFLFGLIIASLYYSVDRSFLKNLADSMLRGISYPLTGLIILILF